MKASELIYCKKSEKRVLLVTSDLSLKEELAGILSQIQMPDSVKCLSNADDYGEELDQHMPHLVVFDIASSYVRNIIDEYDLKNQDTPIICITSGGSSLTLDKKLEGIGNKKIISRDTLRYCGQILYRTIHGFAMHTYYEQLIKTRKSIQKNIEGLQAFQDFWAEVEEIQDPTCKEVLSQTKDMISYLHGLHARTFQTRNN